MLFAALVVPVLAAQKAEAATPDNVCKLDVSLETDSNPTGTTHTLTAVVDPDATCTDTVGAEVDFEIESGPPARVNVTGDAGVGGTASDDGNTPLTPDMTCTTPAITGGGANQQCTVTFTSDTAGTHVIRAWVDDDKDNATFDADATEGRDEVTTPGSRTEPDDTDVVSKTWFATLAANASLDCTPETATNPATGAGNVETYTCTLFNDNGAGGGTPSDGIKNGGEAGIAGVLIDGENRNGANDPDDSNAGTSADYNDVGTTNASGQVTFNIGASEAQAGAANLCFWADADADTDAAGTNGPIDGSGCGELQATVDSNVTDVVTKTWVAVGTAASVTLTPASDQNVHSTSHTVTATVADGFGTPVAGAFVDFNVSGHNAKSQEQSATNLSGQATLTYTDTAVAHTGNPDTDNIVACIDNNADNVAAAGCAPDVGTTTGSASKFWFTTTPVSGQVELDMQMNDILPTTLGGADPNECPDAAYNANATAANAVNTTHELCATVRTSAAVVIPGQSVTFTLSGPGHFTNQAKANLGTSFTVNADANGDAQAAITSTVSGATTVTATSGAATDSGTKTWAAGAARNIDCSPDTDINPTGTSHVIECTATDRYGNPADNTTGPTNEVFFTETGPGRIVSDSSPVIGADGTVEVIVSTTAGEEGTQSITGELEADVGDSDLATDLDDACDQPANVNDAGNAADPGAPAGNCEDTVEKVWSDAPPPPPVETDHARTAHLNRFKHIFLGGGRRALKVSGTLSTDDGFAACSANQPIKVQIRAGGEWITRKSDTTNLNGKFKVLIRDVARKYRAVAPRTQFVNDDNTIDNCLRAVSNVRRHRH